MYVFQYLRKPGWKLASDKMGAIAAFGVDGGGGRGYRHRRSAPRCEPARVSQLRRPSASTTRLRNHA